MLQKIQKGVYVQPPTKRTIIVNKERKFIEFPYIVFIFHKKILYVFSTKEPIKDDLSNKLFFVPIIGGAVCLEHCKSNDELDVINYFWQSEWKMDNYFFNTSYDKLKTGNYYCVNINYCNNLSSIIEMIQKN